MLDLKPDWEYVADTVMGGVSRGRAEAVVVDGRAATRLSGTVSLDNNGGFVQIAFDLADGAVFDASGYSGIALDVRGNGETYDLRLRTDALTRPWHSFRTAFTAPATWTTIRIPFADVTAHRTEASFDPARLRRIGILAIGRKMEADIAVSAVRLYP
ncbi:CIA30 family protein [Tateyamaria sp. SN3-11]|uniref:CIA30 family protein n=1 Tax=Tateyamaria sp. SN3-11 TaxID=3092147 RepID=UPI0039EAB01C